jgi:hypothetical protein
MAVLIMAGASGSVALFAGWAPAFSAAGLVVLYVTGPRGEEWLRRWSATLGAARRRRRGTAPAPQGRTALEAGLRELGLGDHEVLAAVDAALHDDVVLGAYSQDDRLMSFVGPIPRLEPILATEPEHAAPRVRHAVELVARYDGLCIRKTYRDYKHRKLRVRWWSQEAAALERLARVPEVPELVEVRPQALMLYQRFVPGTPLAVLMSHHGLGLVAQQTLRGAYRGPGAWHADADVGGRKLFTERLAAVMGTDFLAALRDLVERIHDAGVIMGDVKYGNVIVTDEGPRLVDFDMARVFRPGSASFRVARERERDLIHYTFGF